MPKQKNRISSDRGSKGGWSFFLASCERRRDENAPCTVLHSSKWRCKAKKKKRLKTKRPKKKIVV